MRCEVLPMRFEQEKATTEFGVNVVAMPRAVVLTHEVTDLRFRCDRRPRRSTEPPVDVLERNELLVERRHDFSANACCTQRGRQGIEDRVIYRSGQDSTLRCSHTEKRAPTDRDVGLP